MQRVVAFFQDMAENDPSFGQQDEIADFQELRELLGGTDHTDVQITPIAGGVYVRKLDAPALGAAPEMTEAETDEDAGEAQDVSRDDEVLPEEEVAPEDAEALPEETAAEADESGAFDDEPALDEPEVAAEAAPDDDDAEASEPDTKIAASAEDFYFGSPIQTPEATEAAAASADPPPIPDAGGRRLDSATSNPASPRSTWPACSARLSMLAGTPPASGPSTDSASLRAGRRTTVSPIGATATRLSIR